MTLRERVYRQLDPSVTSYGLSSTNRLIALLIVVSALVAVLETEPTIVTGRERLFLYAEFVFTALFSVEFAARLWASAENPTYGPGLVGKLRYLRSPAAIFDLLALLPVLLLAFSTEAFLLRMVRLLRILRLARLGRFSDAMCAVCDAIYARRFELLLTFGIAMLLLLITSTVLYVVEAGVQPDNFGSIPRAMWWSIVTLTTVGYGDVYPVTVVGRICAAGTAITGIGVIAMPTGILAAAFSEILQQQKRAA